MKTLRFIVVSMAFATLLGISAMAQAPVDAKVALVNTQAFYDEKEGIKTILNGYTRLRTEFKPEFDVYQKKVTEFDGLKKNYDTLLGNAQKNIPVKAEDIQSKREQLAALETEIKRMQEDLKKKQEKREAEIIGPILREIGKSMQSFAKQKGYTLVLDTGRLYNAQMLIYMDEKADITKEFITFYNSRPAGTATK